MQQFFLVFSAHSSTTSTSPPISLLCPALRTTIYDYLALESHGFLRRLSPNFWLANQVTFVLLALSSTCSSAAVFHHAPYVRLHTKLFHISVFISTVSIIQPSASIISHNRSSCTSSNRGIRQFRLCKYNISRDDTLFLSQRYILRKVITYIT